MKIKKFKELEKETGVDIDSFKVDKPGFKSEIEELTKPQEDKIKKKIQVETPGLKKQIKKFEDFSSVIEVEDDGEEDIDEYDPYSYSGCGCCPVCTGEKDCECGCPDCNCPTDESECCYNSECRCPECISDCCTKCKCRPCECDSISEAMKYHLENGISITENIFRPGSEAFFNILKEARILFDSGKMTFSEEDKRLYESTDIGRFAKIRGEYVPLDLPMEHIEDLNEAKYGKKKVELNHPMRNTGPGKKYYVYVKNPKTGKIKKVTFGDVKGGLTSKVNDPEARKSFVARHHCKRKWKPEDKLSAGYWSCHLPKFKNLVNTTYSGYW